MQGTNDLGWHAKGIGADCRNVDLLLTLAVAESKGKERVSPPFLRSGERQPSCTFVQSDLDSISHRVRPLMSCFRTMSCFAYFFSS